MKIKEETSKLVADCPKQCLEVSSKHCFEVWMKLTVSSKHRFEVVDKTDVYNPR
ncbi:chlorohydrolase [Streptococcus pneumoniae]|nr:chlorohydrolase [Streptococcus pneumoniae]